MNVGRASSAVSARAAPVGPSPADDSVRARLAGLPSEVVRQTFSAQDQFIFVPDFLPPQLTARLVAAVSSIEGTVNRNYLPGHKQGGSVSRHAIDEAGAPVIAELYRSQALIEWLGMLAGERLVPSPADDPHGYALYFYTRPGDHIGWHYDTSYYAGRRYTLLLGVIDDSNCRLEYQLHTRRRGVEPVTGAVRIPPGGLVFFDGDRLRHRITPLGTGERRVSLTFEYVTDPRMHPGWRLISQCKDAIAYFGFRQVFRRAAVRRRDDPQGGR